MGENTDGMMTRRAALLRAAYVLGGAVSASTVAGVLAGCDAGGGTAAGGAAAAPGSSRLLTAEQDEMILSIGEYLIPTTDTPGARAARVNEYIDAMLADFYPEDQRDRFLAGLERVDGYARRRYGARFVDLSDEQQVELAAALHDAAFPAPAGEQDPPAAEPGEGEEGSPAVPADPRDEWDAADVGRNSFMRTLKELVVVGYYTSEVGATQELTLNPMGVWRADIPYSEVGRAWA